MMRDAGWQERLSSLLRIYSKTITSKTLGVHPMMTASVHMWRVNAFSRLASELKIPTFRRSVLAGRHALSVEAQL
jgi:hypothetical protein